MGKLLCEKNLRDVWFRNESVRAEIGQKLVKFCTHTQVTVTVFKTSRHSKLLFFVKKQRTMERKKRSKGRGWESCYYICEFFSLSSKSDILAMVLLRWVTNIHFVDLVKLVEHGR